MGRARAPDVRRQAVAPVSSVAVRRLFLLQAVVVKDVAARAKLCVAFRVVARVGLLARLALGVHWPGAQLATVAVVVLPIDQGSQAAQAYEAVDDLALHIFGISLVAWHLFDGWIYYFF